MLKTILIYLPLLFVTNLFADLTLNETCKNCHPAIYKEYKESAHYKSTIYKDDIHKTIWNMHPNKKKDKYTCAKCHTPSDTRILKALKNGESAIPKDDKIHNEAISCITCHSVESVKKNPSTHDEIVLVNNDKKRPILFAADETNRGNKGLTKRKQSIFGMFKCKSESPYHDVRHSNENFYTGRICLGCHAHMENKLGQNICTTDDDGAIDEESNCITCHMPKVEGSFATAPMSKKHRFHGVAGLRNKPEMMAKYLKMSVEKTQTGFGVTLKNEAKHNLLLHPLRLGKLKVKVTSAGKTISMKPIPFFRILGANGKPAMPWLATEIFKENMLKSEETRTFKYNTKVKAGDEVEVEFGYFLVNPKMAKKLNLMDNKEAVKYNILKRETFHITN